MPESLSITANERNLIETAYARLEAALGRKPSDTLTDEAREAADHAVRGELAFMNGEYVEVGCRDIDWSALHRDHHVWKGRVLRFAYSIPLLQAWRITGNRAYLDALWNFVRDFIRAHPSRTNWVAGSYDNMLDLAARIQHWVHILGVCAGEASVPDEDLSLAVDSIRCQLQYLDTHFSPHGNFRTAQAMAMLMSGLILPCVPEAGAWRVKATRIFNDSARRQILPDGAHIEVTPSYHKGMIHVFATCARLGRAFPELGMHMDAEAVGRMHNYLLAHTRPNGSLSAINDSEGIHEGEVACRHFEDRQAFLEEMGLPVDLPAPTQIFPVARQAVFRSAWETDAEYLTFEASRWGSAHGHLARNSLTLHAYGRSLLLDPGRMEYEMRRPEGPYCKSTRAHNTLTLNGWNQYHSQADDWRAWQSPGLGAAIGRYAGGYWPAPYGWWYFEGLGRGLQAIHTRVVFWVAGRFAAVFDHLNRWNEEGCGELYETPNLEINWQLAPGADVVVDAANARAHTRFPDANLLLSFAQLPASALLAVHEGEREPLRGWVRDGRGDLGTSLSAPQLSIEVPCMAEYITRSLTILVPYRGAMPPAVATEFDSSEKGGPARLRLGWEDGSRDTLIWNESLDFMLGETEIGETDGALLYRRENAGGETEALAMLDGTWYEGPDEATVLAPQMA